MCSELVACTVTPGNFMQFELAFSGMIGITVANFDASSMGIHETGNGKWYRRIDNTKRMSMRNKSFSTSFQ